MADIYCIENQINHKKYIGETLFSYQFRFKEHLYTWLHPRERDKRRPLYLAFSKYGIENFTVTLLEECKDEERWDREIYYIKTLNTHCKLGWGYNANWGGIGNDKFDASDEEVISVYQKYKLITKTAEYFGCCEDTISRRLKKHNISIERECNSYSEEDIQEMIYLYVEKNKTYTYIAKLFNTTPDVISIKLKEQGILMQWQRYRYKLIGQEQSVINKYLECKTLKETADFFEKDEETIKKILIEYDIPLYPSYYKQQKRVHGIRLDTHEEINFNSLAEAGRWCVENKLTNGTADSAASNIGRARSGKRSAICYNVQWSQK